MPVCFAGMPDRRRLSLLALIGLTLGLLLVPLSARTASTGKRSPKRRAKIVKPTPVPTPTPIPLLRAAGTCLRYEPNQYVIVAEVGQVGRVFRLDAESKIQIPRLKVGSRVRVLFEETSEGPVVRKLMPGPEAPH